MIGQKTNDQEGICKIGAREKMASRSDPTEHREVSPKILYSPIRSDRIDLKWELPDLHGMFTPGQLPRGNPSLFG